MKHIARVLWETFQGENPMTGEQVAALCEDIPGSMVVCVKSLITIRSHKFVDLCDKYNIRGEMIWKLYKDVCNEDIWKTMILLEHIDNVAKGETEEVINLNQLVDAINGNVTFNVQECFNKIVESWKSENDPVSEAIRIATEE